MANVQSRIDLVDDFLARRGVYLEHVDPTDTSTSVAVVALPKTMDPIRLVGDVDKHATLLFFGDVSTLPSDAKDVLVETLQNVSRICMPFSEGIQDISRLGSDDPPALVAMLSNTALERIRETLLVNPRVGELLSNADQYPNFTPHVTLAYPDYQGEAQLRTVMKGLYRVRFDRLALWWGEEHIEFSLDSFDAESGDFPMAQTAMSDIEDYLAHHGVKGMKWGVRRAASSASGVLSNKKVKAAVQTGRVALSSPKVRKEAVGAAKVAFTIGKYGVVPLAAATGIGIPAVAGLGLSMKFMSDPAVHAAVSAAGKYSSSVVKNIGGINMSAVKQFTPHVTVKNPFSTTTSRMREAGAKNPTFRVRDGKYQLKTNQGWVGVSAGIVKSGLNQSH